MRSDRSNAAEYRATLKSLESSYCPALIKEARKKQDEMLIERFQGRPYAIADIGCGTGYHGRIFAPSCRLYHGFEIAVDIAEIARNTWRVNGLNNTELFVGDVAEAELAPEFYDLAFCLYFTAGNLRDKSDDLTFYTDSYLNRNSRFIAIVSRFFQALKPGGYMFLTIYKDLPQTEEAQIDFYENTDQHVITPRGSRFVATAEGFWSVRWTEQSMLSNLEACGIGKSDVLFHDLNAIAWLVEIVKP